MIIHAIGGMPRAGTTLVCGILSQRPDTFASSTSCLPGLVRTVGAAASSRLEFKALMDRDLQGTQARFQKSVQAFCQGWHSHHNREVVFDKSRAWNMFPDTFRDISPEGKIIVCVRDLRDIFASAEIAERKNGLITAAPPSVVGRYRRLFAADGVIGNPYNSVLDLLDRNPDNVVMIRYEDLIADPQSVMDLIAEECGIEQYEHDFNNILDTACDPDGHYLGKWPHRVHPVLDPTKLEGWEGVVPSYIAADIMANAPKYNEVFKYEGETKKLGEDIKTPAMSKAYCAMCKKETALTCHVYGVGHVCGDCQPNPLDNPSYTEADRKMDQTLLAT